MNPATLAKFEWNDKAEKHFAAKFNSIDADKDGKLTFDEVREHLAVHFLRSFGQNPTDTEVKEFMDGIDKDGDGAVSMDELRDWLKELIVKLQDHKKSMDMALDVMFRACDVDKNGKISKEELRNFMTAKGYPVHDKIIDEIFRKVDMDGDTTSLTKEGKDVCDLLANSVDPDQTARMRRLVWAHAGRIGPKIPEDMF